MKKFLILALMLSAVVNGFSKEKYETEDAAIEAAKSIVQNLVNNNLLTPLKTTLETGDGKVKWKNGVDKSTQFIYETSKVANLYKDSKVRNEATQLGEIYKKLIKKYKGNVSFTYKKLNVGSKKNEQVNGNKIIYTIPVSFEVYAETPDNVSNAKYKVTLNYKVALKKDTKKGCYEVDKPAFENSDVKATAFFDSENAYMKQKVSEKISAWYNGIPANLDTKYNRYVNNNKGIKPVNGNDIKLNQNGKVFTAIGKPIEIDFVPEIDPSSLHLYTDPTATISITPSFTIVFSDDLKTIVSENIVTSYKDEIKKATTDSDKVCRYESACNAMTEFSNALSKYVTDNSKENREKVMVMFTDSKKDDVAVSHRSKHNNKESIDQRKVDKYLQRLKGNSLIFKTFEYIDSDKSNQLNEEYPQLGVSYDSNLYTVMFDVIQQYDGNNYKDSTRKVVFMKRQDDNSYLIEKIVVVPNSTKIE